MLKCEVCGEAVVGSGRFCSGCGAALGATTSMMPPPPILSSPVASPAVPTNGPRPNRASFWPARDETGQVWALIIFLALLLAAIVVGSCNSKAFRTTGSGGESSSSIKDILDSVRRARDSVDGSPGALTALNYAAEQAKPKLVSKADEATLNEIVSKGRKRHNSLAPGWPERNQRMQISLFAGELKSKLLSASELDARVASLRKAVTMPVLSAQLKEAINAARRGQDRLRQSEKDKAAEAARLAVKKKRDQMGFFEGDGSAQVAVGDVKVARSLFGYYFNGSGRFVSVWASVTNNGEGSIHANPLNFTLATSDGSTSSVASITYRYSNAFDAVDLSPGQTARGWIAFETTKDMEYILTYRDLGGDTVVKTLIP